MVCGSDTPPDEGPSPPWRLGALPTRTQKSRKCRINTFKNSSYSPFERSASAWRESQRVPLQCRCPSFSWPSWTPCRTGNPEPRLKPIPLLAGSQHELAFTRLKAITNRIQKLCSCIRKTAQKMHNVLHIQTVCNSANHQNCVNCWTTENEQFLT